MPLRQRDTSTVQAAADAFLSSPRYANPNTRRGYTGVLAAARPRSCQPARTARHEHLNATARCPARRSTERCPAVIRIKRLLSGVMAGD